MRCRANSASSWKSWRPISTPRSPTTGSCPTYKGSYTETVTAAIFAFRSRSQPAIVQVNEIATATMMAAKGAIYPVFELMRDQSEPFSPEAYLPAVTGYYSDVAGNMLSFPFNVSTPILYYNKDLFRAAGLDPEVAPKTWPEVGAAAKRLRAAGSPCGLTTSWPSWINVENFSAFHNLPLATRTNGFGGLDAELAFNNPRVVRHIAQLAEWQGTKVFDYSGRGQSAEPRFQKGECAIFIGSSATRADIKANSKFEVGYGMIPYWPDIAGAPQNTIIGGATLWVLRDRPRAEYAGVARFFAYLSKPEVQAAWHQNTGYLPITRAAFDLTRAQGFYDRNPGAAMWHRAADTEAADGEFERDPARILCPDPRRHRGRTRAGFQRQAVRAGRPRPRRRARQSPAAPVRAGESGPVGRGAQRTSAQNFCTNYKQICIFVCNPSGCRLCGVEGISKQNQCLEPKLAFP